MHLFFSWLSMIDQYCCFSTGGAANPALLDACFAVHLSGTISKQRALLEAPLLVAATKYSWSIYRQERASGVSNFPPQHREAKNPEDASEAENRQSPAEIAEHNKAMATKVA